MTGSLIAVLSILALAMAMFLINRPRMDVVAIVVMALLPFTGVLSINETIAGFGDSSVVLVGLMFILGEGLVRTGVAQRVGDLLIARAGSSETVLIILLMSSVCLIGSVMSSTGVVAIFIPVVLRICATTRIAPRRLMMPLSIGALISGMTTLVATAPNLVVNGELLRHDQAGGFGFFTFTPFGLPILLLAIVYMLLARRLLGESTVAETEPLVRPTLQHWVDEYELASREFRARVEPGSPLIGKSLAELKLRRHGLNVLAIERQGRLNRELTRPLPATVFHVGDTLFFDVIKSPDADAAIDETCAAQGLSRLPLTGHYFTDQAQELGMAEVIVPADSHLIGKTVIRAGIRSKFDLTVIGLKRGGEPLKKDLLETPLKVGDMLLVVGPWRAIRNLRAEASDLLPFNLPTEFDQAVPAGRRAPFALLALAITVGLMVSGVVPTVHAAIIGCLLMGLFRCVDLPSAYRSVHWPTLILIVGMFPFSLALQRTGGVDMASNALLSVIGGDHPRLLIAGLFATTMIIGMFISNTATAVLMAPVAIGLAQQLGMSPLPFAMTVALAASTAFITPFSTPVNTLVVGPGGYSFGDFVRVGLPLSILVLIACVLLIPIVLPLHVAP